RKQKLPKLQIIDVEVAKRTPGLNGDSTFIALRLISIEQEQNYKNENKSECFIIELFYLSELDIGHVKV
ncbi:9657_t:CDS:2, partial [Rhizophagus irregularis]